MGAPPDENETDQTLTIDIALSALPASKRAQGSKKGYVAKKRNQYTRQLARVLVAETSEIIAQSLYPGNTLSLSVFKEMVDKMEHYLQLETKVKLKQLKLRIDAGFGTDDNINFALWRGYHILVKVYSGKRARKLAKSVKDWVSVPSEALNTQREAGWVTSPHRYCRKTMQVAVRTQTDKGGYAYSVLVTTQMDASLAEIVTEDDKRGGAPEIILPGLSRTSGKEKA